MVKVMDIPDIGVFSPYTLTLHSHATGKHWKAFIKRSLVLFDRLLFIPVGLGSDPLIAKELFLTTVDPDDGFCRTREFSDVFLLDSDFFDNPEHFLQEVDEYLECDLWTGENGDQFVNFVEEHVQEALKNRQNVIEQWELAKELIGNISYDYKLLAYISRDSPELSGLLSELHESAVLYTFGQNIRSTEQTIRVIEDINCFDFLEISWSDLFFLRKSGFCQDFRTKIFEWIHSSPAAENAHEFSSRLQRYIDDAKFKFIARHEPSIRRTILSGILGNIPFPIPINHRGLVGLPPFRQCHS